MGPGPFCFIWSMKILKTSDRVRVKVGDIALTLAPLKQSQKVEMAGLTKVIDGKETADLNAMMSYLVKHSVKGVEGVLDGSEAPLELEFDHDGSLSEDSHTDVMFVISKAKAFFDPMFKVGGNEMPSDKVKSWATGEEIEGVEVLLIPKPKAQS